MPSTTATATASESGSRVLFSLLLFLLLLMFSFSLNEVNGSELLGNGSIEVGEMVPMVKLGEEEMVLMMNNNFSSMGRRRLLGSFQICAPCTCCAKGYCLPSPCCYSINCNIPNRPFGFCSFTPKTCNCFNCHL